MSIFRSKKFRDKEDEDGGTRKKYLKEQTPSNDPPKRTIIKVRLNFSPSSSFAGHFSRGEVKRPIPIQ